jgi:hypothetical protein
MFRDYVVYVLLCYFDCSYGWLEHLFWADIFYIHWCVNLFLALYLDLFEYIKYEWMNEWMNEGAAQKWEFSNH